MNSLIKPRVVIDTNVFISGTLFGGIPSTVLDIVLDDRVVLLMSPELAVEVMHALKYFPVTQKNLEDAEYIVVHHARDIQPIVDIKKSRDPKDDMLLALSLAGHADFLITGDKDLLVLQKFGDTKIVTPKQFLDKTHSAP